MPPVNQELVKTFTAKATAVNAVVVEAASLEEVLKYVVDVCETKAPAEMMADEPGAEKGPLGPNKMPTRVKRIVAAPDLDEENFAKLAAACEAKGFACLKSGLRKHLAGIDVGLNFADLGVAASGTCMVNCDDEEARLASMISEVSVLVMKKSEIYPDLPSIAQKLRERMNAAPSTNTTFISGPSRTADIERVAAVGVHGPLELHVVLLEG